MSEGRKEEMKVGRLA